MIADIMFLIGIVGFLLFVVVGLLFMPPRQSAIDRQNMLEEQRAQTSLMQQQLSATLEAIKTIKEVQAKATP